MITSYYDLPYSLYFEIMGIKEENDIDADARIVALLSGKTLDEVLRMPLTDYFTLREQASFLFNQPDIHYTRKAVYEVGGFRLVPCADIRKMQTAQYTDWQEYLKQEDNKAELLSCFLIPEGMTYNEGYDIVEVQTAIREHLSIMDYLDLLDFFQERLRKLMRASLTYSEKIAQKKEVKRTLRQLRLSLPSGTGSRRWTLFLRLPALIMRRSTDFRCSSSLPSSASISTRPTSE